MAVETGLGGVVALRAIVPVTVEGRHVGVLEFVLAAALARLTRRDAHRGAEDEIHTAALERLVNTYRGQMEANYGEQLIPRPALREAS